MPFVIKKLHAPHKQKAFLFLIKELGYTQREAQRMIAKGRLFIDGEPMTNNYGTVDGPFEFVCFESSTRGLNPLFITSEFAVFDKPSGVLIHPQNRYTPYSLVDEIRHHFGRDANITHRIDQETSGLVLAARNKKSERDLKMMFEHRQMQKYYVALVHGHVSRETEIDVPLLRQEDASAIVRLTVKVHEDGKASKTFIRPLKYLPEHDMTLVEAKPYTGRQHQIRVHLFHVKHPIVGDPIYGQKEEDVLRFLDKEITPEERLKLSGATRLLLHASQLDFEYKGHHYSIHSKTDFIEEALKAMETVH
ncbi:MAG: RluA family pseudouridine synthase [Campylobacterota bacterium]|nr:RluA family pseudouridine synthase [Campylobacterota bacterium]